MIYKWRPHCDEVQVGPPCVGDQSTPYYLFCHPWMRLVYLLSSPSMTCLCSLPPPSPGWPILPEVSSPRPDDDGEDPAEVALLLLRLLLLLLPPPALSMALIAHTSHTSLLYTAGWHSIPCGFLLRSVLPALPPS